jgi:hypothetical protein
MDAVPASRQAFTDVAGPALEVAVRAPDRVYVRSEQSGRIRLLLWGMEHRGVRCEVVEPAVPGRPLATWAIERDLRRGVGL